MIKDFFKIEDKICYEFDRKDENGSLIRTKNPNPQIKKKKSKKII